MHHSTSNHNLVRGKFVKCVFFFSDSKFGPLTHHYPFVSPEPNITYILYSNLAMHSSVCQSSSDM